MRFYWTIMSKNNIRIQKNSKFGVFIDKLSQSNFILWLPDCHLVRSYLIATVQCSAAFQSCSIIDVEKKMFEAGSFREKDDMYRHCAKVQD